MLRAAVSVRKTLKKNPAEHNKTEYNQTQRLLVKNYFKIRAELGRRSIAATMVTSKSIPITVNKNLIILKNRSNLIELEHCVLWVVASPDVQST